MRIGLVVERMEPARGGAEQWTFQFAKWLLEQGHDVNMVTTRVDDQVAQLGFHIHRLHATNSRLQFATAAERKLRELQCDVSHDMGYGWYCDVFQPHGGSRRAANEQNLLLKPAWQRALRRAAQPLLPRYREFDKLMSRQYQPGNRQFIALSDRVARDFEQLHRVPRSQISRIYNGVDISRFAPSKRTEFRERARLQCNVRRDETMILLVAHNLRLKGLPTLIKATAILRQQHQPIRVVVVGGKRQHSLERLVARESVADRVTFMGSVSDPVPFYAAADIYVQPTFYDPCSLVVLEALACGLPVVTSQYNGVAELMSDGVEGRIVDDPSDATELAAKLTPILEPQLRTEMAQSARQLAESNEQTSSFQRILQLYGRVIRRAEAA